MSRTIKDSSFYGSRHTRHAGNREYKTGFKSKEKPLPIIPRSIIRQEELETDLSASELSYSEAYNRIVYTRG